MQELQRYLALLFLSCLFLLLLYILFCVFKIPETCAFSSANVPSTFSILMLNTRFINCNKTNIPFHMGFLWVRYLTLNKYPKHYLPTVKNNLMKDGISRYQINLENNKTSIICSFFWKGIGRGKWITEVKLFCKFQALCT